VEAFVLFCRERVPEKPEAELRALVERLPIAQVRTGALLRQLEALGIQTIVAIASSPHHDRELLRRSGADGVYRDYRDMPVYFPGRSMMSAPKSGLAPNKTVL